MDGIAFSPNTPNNEMMEKINILEKENQQLKEGILNTYIIT